MKHFVLPLLSHIPKVNSEYVRLTLIELASFLGETIITDHIIPTLKDLLQTYSTKSSNSDDVLIDTLFLIEGIMPFLSPEISSI